MKSKRRRVTSYRDATRRTLDTSHKAHDQYLKQIKEKYPALARFEEAAELLGALHDPAVNASTKDAILLSLLEAHKRGDRHGSALTLTLTAMLPALDQIYRTRLGRLVKEPDELWGRIIAAFGEAVDHYPISRRPRRVAANLKGDTMAALRRNGLRARRAKLAQDGLAAATMPFLDDAASDAGFSIGDLIPSGLEATTIDEGDVAAAAHAASRFFDASGVTEHDRFLILGVHLYDRPLHDLAASLGLQYHAAYKRLTRAIARLRARGRSGA